MVQIAGKYKIVKNENLAAYLKSFGIPDELAKKAEQAVVTIEITVEGERYTITSSSGMGNLDFVIGQEFDEEMPLGAKVKTIANREGDNKLVLKSQVSEKPGTFLRTYEFSDSGITITLSGTGVVAKRIYSRE